jgi:hypothetical protein
LFPLLGASCLVLQGYAAHLSIIDIDVPFGTITLDNGQTFQVAPPQKFGPDAFNSTPAVLASFRLGDKVVVRFNVFGGRLAASSVAPAKG